MIAFLDANVPIYAAGRDHPYREPCARILRMVAAHPRSFIADVEILQELMHRYIGSRQWPRGREVLQRFAEVMSGRVEPFYVEDVQLAAELADRYPGISARDYIHVAVMRRLRIERIISADRDFDRLPDITRLDPANLREWEGSVLSV